MFIKLASLEKFAAFEEIETEFEKTNKIQIIFLQSISK